MKRRMVALREKKGYASFLEYLKAMDTDRQLYEEFLDRMTINVSEFYRNPIRWQQLEEDIPVLDENWPAKHSVQDVES
jgi:chemotaxis protein methyltransferase CheR